MARHRVWCVRRRVELEVLGRRCAVRSIRWLLEELRHLGMLKIKRERRTKTPQEDGGQQEAQMSIGNGNVFLGLIVDVDVVSLKGPRLRKLVPRDLLREVPICPEKVQEGNHLCPISTILDCQSTILILKALFVVASSQYGM